MPARRLLDRSVWLALPVTITLVVLAGFGQVAPWAALLAWLLGLILSGVLAFLRERQLEATGRYLAALAEGREPPPLPEFGQLGGDELATLLHRLDRALSDEHLVPTPVRLGDRHAGTAERRVDVKRIGLDSLRYAARLTVEQVARHDLEVVVGRMGEGALSVAVAERPDA